MSVTTTLFGTIPAVVGRPGAAIDGTEEGEWIFGTEADDVIVAGAGDDFIQAIGGSNTISAGDGNDTVLGGAGDDTIEGGSGNDVLSGGGGANTFLFDPSRAEGDDVIVDFTAENGDAIALSAAGLSRVGIDEFSGAALDQSEDFDIVEDAETGDQVIEHPGGTITLFGVPFPEEGQDELSFAALEADGLLTTSGLVSGTDEGEELTGTDGDDVIIAGGGDDTVTPGSGNDIITLGGGRDTVNIDPSNPNEGNDVITDFSAPSALDPTSGDTINFALEHVLEADPDLPAADGDAESLSLADFDASANWTIGASEAGNLLLAHPNGSVELGNVAFADQTFEGLSSMITIDGEEVTEPIPVDDVADGDDGDDVADGDDGVDDGTDGDDVADGDDGVVDDGTGDDVADGDDGGADDGTDGDDVADGDDGVDDGTDGDDVAGEEDGADGQEEVAASASSDPMEDAIA